MDRISLMMHARHVKRVWRRRVIGVFIIRDSQTYIKKPRKAPDLPMKYSRIFFLPKNDSLLENILPVIEHSVKNEENVRFPGHF